MNVVLSYILILNQYRICCSPLRNYSNRMYFLYMFLLPLHALFSTTLFLCRCSWIMQNNSLETEWIIDVEITRLYEFTSEAYIFESTRIFFIFILFFFFNPCIKYLNKADDFFLSIFILLVLASLMDLQNAFQNVK